VLRQASGRLPVVCLRPVCHPAVAGV